MRLKNMVKGDIWFQMKYGFYFVYLIFTILYILLLFTIPETVRSRALIILIFSDPAAMGLFFMGAIVLLEKSQRVVNSIAVSPVKVTEYIQSKAISLGIIGTLVAVLLSVAIGQYKLIGVVVGTLFGSFLFSLFGLIIAAKISSINQFIIATVPIEILCFFPPMFYLFGYRSPYMMLHPGCIIIAIIAGEQEFKFFWFVILTVWILLIYFITIKVIKRMFRSVGGDKL